MKKVFLAIFLIILLIGAYFFSKKDSKGEEYRLGDMFLQLSITPNPPKVGDNKFTLKLFDAKHNFISDANIAIDYGMPAMGNMPAMHSQAKAELKGDKYNANLSLSMLGSWDVILNLDLNNQMKKQFNLKITTGQKGIIYYPQEDIPQMDMDKNESMLRLTALQMKLAQVRSMPLQKYHLFQEIRAAGEVAYDQDLQVAQDEYISALDDASNQALALNKLKLLGISAKELNGLRSHKKSDPSLTFPENKAWVYAYIYEYEIGSIHPGQMVEIKTVAFPDQIFKGIVRAIVPVLDEKNRSYKLRIEVSNAQKKLQANMYVDIYAHINLGLLPAIPKAALLKTGKQEVIYIDKTKGYYEKRNAKVGILAYTMVQGEPLPFYPLYSGAELGELIVVASNFLLDSQSEISGNASSLYGSSAKEIKEHEEADPDAK